VDFKTNISRTARLTVIVGLLLNCIGPSAAQQTGKVQISSLNVNDQIVPFIDVIIEGNGIRRELVSRGVGDEYENGGLIELPVGTYRVTTRKRNYFDFRRAPFQVRPGTVTRINIFTLLYVRRQSLMSNGNDRYELAPKPAYDVYRIPQSPGHAISMLVRYDKKYKSGNNVDYGGGAASAVDRGVMVSYDALAVYADKLRFDRKNFTLTAQGNVIVEDGTQRIKPNNVTVRFNNGAPEVTTN
jgi:hypothetical protein